MELNGTAYSTPRRNAYASTLQWGGRVAFSLLVGAFVLYITGLIEPQVAIDRIDSLWTLSAAEYLQHTQTSAGWGWLQKVKYAEFLNIVPLAILSSLSCLCYILLVPFLVKERDWYLLLIAIAQIIVLLLAASGLVSGAH